MVKGNTQKMKQKTGLLHRSLHVCNAHVLPRFFALLLILL